MHPITLDRARDKPDRSDLQYGDIFEKYKEHPLPSDSVRLYLRYYRSILIFRYLIQ